MRALVFMGVLLIMKLSSEFTFDYKYIINGFQHHNELCAHILARADILSCERRGYVDARACFNLENHNSLV